MSVSEATHPARVALDGVGLGPLQSEPQVLHQVAKSTIYRLPGAAPDGSAVIAKYGELEPLENERVVYQDVLAALGVPALRCFGLVAADPGWGWLLLEEAVGVEYDPSVAMHRVLAAGWLGSLHAAVRRTATPVRLSSRGHEHYLAHLRAARGRIYEGLRNPYLPVDAEQTLRRVLAALDRLEAGWEEIVVRAQELAPVVVHGDFVGKNVRLGSVEDVAAVRVFDWEVAGWGPPGVDLARFALERCDASIRRYCAATGAPPRAVVRNAESGVVFRLIAAVDWIAVELVAPERAGPHYAEYLRIEPLADLSLYSEWMDDALARLEL